MRYKALVSFSGQISMAMGEVREISDQSIVDDLLKARYIISIEPKEEKAKTDDVEKPKPKTKRKENKDGN